MSTVINPPKVKGETLYRVTYERRTFCGIIKWWVEMKAEKCGSTLFIETSEHVRNIIVNGKSI